MLPFVTAPTKQYEKVQVGNEEIGILEIEKLEDLSQVERRFIKEQGLFNYQKELATLSKKVSREHGDRFSYVNDRINSYVFGGVIEGDTVEIIGDNKALKAFKNKQGEVVRVVYNKDFSIKEIIVLIDEKEVLVTLDQVALISPEWYAEAYCDIEELSTNFLASLKTKNIVYATAIIRHRLQFDWTIEKTEDPDSIHPKLVTQIAEFAYKEENGWGTAQPVEPKPSTEEELGKS